MSGPGSTIRWRWVAILILLGGGAQLAPLVSPGILFPWSVVWLLLLVAIAGTLVREIANRSWLVTTTLVVAAIGIPAALLGVDWSGRWGTYLPCRRNWEWLPSYFLRASPTQSLTGEVGQTRFKICYGSPRVRGRKVIGGPTVPFGHLWRTGANEPTTIRLAGPLDLAGIRIGPGKVAIYSVPGPETWEVIANRSTGQWGLETEYTAAVAQSEIARAVVESRPAEFVEALSFHFEPESDPENALLVLRWERTEVRIPLRASAPHR